MSSSPIETLDQAAAYLAGLINYERRPEFSYPRLGLEPIRRLLECVGNPQHGMSVVHIAGSKGKGSTALLAESVLVAGGESVGVFTSPHLERWTERFRVDGREVAAEALAATVECLRPHVDRLREEEPQQAPTFFDATTAVALCLFRQAAVRRVILEVGLGGRLDSTNIVEPAVTCVTSIELEHTDKLGDTPAAIAAEKAGIVKAGVPVVMGDLAPPAAAVVEARAETLGAPCFRLGRDFHVEMREKGPGALDLRFKDGELELAARLPLLGEHHGRNAALALACLLRLPDAWPPAVFAEAARSGLATARLPGRVEVLGGRPWCVVDGAHTAASARALADALGGLPRRRTRLLLSVSAGKDLASILDALLEIADEVVVTCAEPVRSLRVEVLESEVRAAAPALSVRAISDPRAALAAARDGLAPDDLLCVTGSVYLAGIAREVLLRDGPEADSSL